MPSPADPFAALVADAFARSDAAGGTYERGLILEDLVRDAFGSIAGFRYWKSRQLTSGGDAEFDVCFHHDPQASPLHDAGDLLVVEAKNTGAPMTSASLLAFVCKLWFSDLHWGIVVAANGITGSGERNSHAHEVIRTARIKKINVLVITRRDLEALGSAAEFQFLLIEKLLSHTIRSPRF